MDRKKTAVFLSFILAVIFSQSISFAYTANFTYVGTMPLGTLWTVSVDGTTYSSIESNITVEGLTGTVNYQYETPVGGTSGIRYVCVGTNCSGTLNADNNTTAEYQTQYRLQMSINESGAGTTSPAIGANWYNSGTSVSISANPSSNYIFSLWTGSGTGTFYTGIDNPRTITMDGPINERGDFTKKITLNFTKSGIPAGTLWGVTVNGVPYTSTGSRITVSGLLGTINYAYDSIVSGTPGTRYMCNSGCSGSASSDMEVNANYQIQYLLTMSINITEAGSTAPSVGTSWRNEGDSITLSTSLNDGYELDKWVGSGSGSYSGTSDGQAITMNGPISESAKIVELITYINSISDVQTYCQYFPNSYTYYCTEKLNWAPSATAVVQETYGSSIIDYSLATFTENSTTGSYTGTNPLIVNAGGTCRPINANISITGICEGTRTIGGSCSWLPEVNITHGLFQKIDGGTSCAVCSWYSGWYTCSAGFVFPSGEGCNNPGCSAYSTYGSSENGCAFSYSCFCHQVTCIASCSTTSTNPLNQGRAATSGSCGTTTYYTPCTYKPAVSVNGMFFQYPGLVTDTTTVSMELNNLNVGANSLQMSALESGKYNYTIKWTEASSSTPCVTSASTKAYHITSGNIFQRGESARIINGTFSMKFDSALKDTTIALLKDDTNAVVSARISSFDANNLKLEIYNGSWILMANNIQPRVWYDFAIKLDEAGNTIYLKVANAEYPEISQTYTMPVASPAIKWISVASNGAWLDNVNIEKRDISNNLISTYSDDFESYTDGEKTLYSSQLPFYNIIINNDLTPDLAGSNRKNIVARAIGKFESKNFYLDGAYPGAAGTLDVTARSIKIDNIRSNSAYESSNSDHIQACGGGTTILTGNNVSVLSIQALGGWTKSQWSAGCGTWSSASSGCGNGGNVYITANKTNIGTISLYAPNVDMYASGGGVAQIDSEIINAANINVNGGCGRAGGNGGKIVLKGGNISIPQIIANGCDASGNSYCVGGQAGSGGPVTIVAKYYTNISSVSTNGGSGEKAGGGGSVRLSTTNIKEPIKISANGASGGVFTGTTGNGNEYEYATPASAGGTVNIYADHIDSEVNISITGGDAVGMSYFTGFSTGCELGSAGVGGIAAIFSDNLIKGNLNINNKGGSGADYRNTYTYDCQILGGSDGGVILRKRTWGGFIGMNSSILDTTHNSYLIRIKDIWTDRYVRQKNYTFLDYYYNKTFFDGTESGISVKKIVNAQIGFPGNTPPLLPTFDLALGKDYQLEITASPCSTFDEPMCSHATDRTYIVPFVEY